jgi:hypothetical protein
MTGEQRGNKSVGRGARPARNNRGSYQQDSEFVNLELTNEQRNDYRNWRQDLEEVENLWSEVCEEGYRVNTKYDDYSSAYAAFVIPDGQSDNAGYILTGRGGSPYRAVSEALFKHRFLLQGNWANFPQRPRLSDDPDF